MKIIKLQSENVKRLKAIEIKPNGNVVTISGGNGEGKSSILDSIEYALAGSKHLPAKPLRKGTEKGRIVCELDDLIVTRTFTKNDSNLKIEAKNGAKYSSPQSILDKVIGNLSFDPLEFSRMKPDKQLETLRKLVGVDFTEIDKEKKRVYDERTLVGRESDRLKSLFQSSSFHEGVPEDEISVAELTDKLTKANQKNSNNQKERQKLVQAESLVENSNNEIKGIEEELIRLQTKLVLAKENNNKKIEDRDLVKSKISGLKDLDTKDLSNQIKSSEEINNKIRENKKKLEHKQNLGLKEREYNDLTSKIKLLDDEKVELLTKAKFPLKELSFDESGVLLNDLPFEQASQAEKIKASVAIGLALNPKLKVILIRDGSLLDEKSMKVVEEMANETGYQIWVEKCHIDGDKSAIIIEDGMIKGQNLKPEEDKEEIKEESLDTNNDW